MSETFRQFGDRELVGMLIEREVESRYTWTSFAALSNVSRSTLHRATVGDLRVSRKVFRRIERALSLPFDMFASVEAHDFAALTQMGVDRGLVEWIESKATTTTSTPAKPSAPTSSSAKTAPRKPTTHSRPATSRGSER